MRFHERRVRSFIGKDSEYVLLVAHGGRAGEMDLDLPRYALILTSRFVFISRSQTDFSRFGIGLRLHLAHSRPRVACPRVAVFLCLTHSSHAPPCFSQTGWSDNDLS